MLRIGTPASVSMIARPLSTFLLLKVIASFGTAAIAAFGIALRSFAVNWIPQSGINTAISALVGQNLGRRDADEATRVVLRGLILDTLLGRGLLRGVLRLRDADHPRVRSRARCRGGRRTATSS